MDGKQTFKMVLWNGYDNTKIYEHNTDVGWSDGDDFLHGKELLKAQLKTEYSSLFVYM